MADSDSGEAIGALIGGLLLVMVVVTLVTMAIMALMSLGALFGAGTALHNYGLAFANNVKPERVRP
jgi:hypothetical protein